MSPCLARVNVKTTGYILIDFSCCIPQYPRIRSQYVCLVPIVFIVCSNKYSQLSSDCVYILLPSIVGFPLPTKGQQFI